MLDSLERRKGLQGDGMTTQPVSGVEKLRQQHRDTKDKAVIDIAQIVTKVMGGRKANRS